MTLASAAVPHIDSRLPVCTKPLTLKSASNLEMLMAEEENFNQLPSSRISQAMEVIKIAHRAGNIERDIIRNQRQTDVMGERSTLQSTHMNLSDIFKFWVESSLFKLSVNIVVFANTVVMGIEADYPNWEGWIFVENVFTVSFTAEMLFKVFALKLEYFYDKYNWLDFSLVVLGIVDCWILNTIVRGTNVDLRTLSILRILRLLRLIRILRLVKGSSQMILVIQGVVDALKCTFWVSVVMLLVIYVGAIFCMVIVGEEGGTSIYPGHAVTADDIAAMDIVQDFNPHVAFGSLGGSIISLFNLAINASWAEIVVPVSLMQPPLVLFFFGFYFIMFGLMNVIVGLIVDRVLVKSKKLDEEARQAQLSSKLDMLNNIQEFVAQCDEDEDGVVSFEELERHLIAEDSELFDMLSSFELTLPIGFTADELFCMLDTDGDKCITTDEFVQSFYRLLHSGPFQQVCLLQTGMNSLKQTFKENQKSVMNKLDALEKLIKTGPKLGETDTPTWANHAAQNKAAVPTLPAAAKNESHAKLPDLLERLQELLQMVLKTLEFDMKQVSDIDVGSRSALENKGSRTDGLESKATQNVEALGDGVTCVFETQASKEIVANSTTSKDFDCASMANHAVQNKAAVPTLPAAAKNESHAKLPDLLERLQELLQMVLKTLEFDMKQVSDIDVGSRSALESKGSRTDGLESKATQNVEALGDGVTCVFETQASKEVVANSTTSKDFDCASMASVQHARTAQKTRRVTEPIKPSGASKHLVPIPEAMIA